MNLETDVDDICACGCSARLHSTAIYGDAEGDVDVGLLWHHCLKCDCLGFWRQHAPVPVQLPEV